ncbi:uncharacterized protein ycf45-like isoform X1 [Magnolia sinica]|uniref:uncharacterized protein ycf45-like isoform X1 n=1 Tax=Magnolia sinica TaxID=86752 RepID=UPI002657FEE9|nr:uncharacterized protein ycf45-like isoform X1 [Magnolia sinica]
MAAQKQRANLGLDLSQQWNLNIRQVGGVETVTLGDDEAPARGCQKSILERKAPPTFHFLIEMRERKYWVTHRTERSVDMLLHGKKPLVEVMIAKPPYPALL